MKGKQDMETFIWKDFQEFTVKQTYRIFFKRFETNVFSFIRLFTLSVNLLQSEAETEMKRKTCLCVIA